MASYINHNTMVCKYCSVTFHFAKSFHTSCTIYEYKIPVPYVTETNAVRT